MGEEYSSRELPSFSFKLIERGKRIDLNLVTKNIISIRENR